MFTKKCQYEVSHIENENGFIFLLKLLVILMISMTLLISESFADNTCYDLFKRQSLTSRITNGLLAMVGVGRQTVGSSNPIRPLDQRLELSIDQMQSGWESAVAARARGERLIAIDLSKVAETSQNDFNTGLSEAVRLLGTPRVVSVSLKNTHGEDRAQKVYDAIQEIFGTSVPDYNSSLPANSNLIHAIDAVLKNTGFLIQLVIKDFTPESSSQENFSSLIRALINRGATQPDFARLVVFMTSEVPMSNWGAAQGGMNLGHHLVIEP